MKRFSSLLFSVLCLGILLPTASVSAQQQQQAQEECHPKNDIDANTSSAIERTVQQFFSSAAAGDAESLRRNAIPAIAGSFQSIAATVQGNKDKIAGGQSTIRSEYVLSAPGPGNYERAEFICGLFNSPDRTSFIIPGLPPGTYALVIQDVKGSKVPFTITYVLQQNQGAWQLAGYYARPRQIGPHDGLWYWVQAREMKKQNQAHNSFFYYMTAADLLAPVPFMSTTQLDKLYEEEQAAAPKDLPTGNNSVPVNLAGRTYNVIQAFPVADDSNQGLQLVVKYQAISDISNTGQAYQDSMNFLKSLATQFPEYKTAFTALVARAVGPNGQDYGVVLPVKDIK
jgi:hypothetical protein